MSASFTRLLPLSSSPREETPGADVDAFIRQVETTTPWMMIESKEIHTYSLTMDALGKTFQKLTVADARTVVKRLSDCSPEEKKLLTLADRSKLSTVYILLRYYFYVPSWEHAERVKFFGGWDGVPEKDTQFAILWPLTENADGSVHLDGMFQGYYGEPYDALGEFDYFSDKYGPRMEESRELKRERR
jgi:hypothetical protein